MIIHQNSTLIYLDDSLKESTIQPNNLAEHTPLNLLAYDIRTAIRQKLAWHTSREIYVSPKHAVDPNNFKLIRVKFETVNFGGNDYDTLLLPISLSVLVNEPNHYCITAAMYIKVGDLIACVDFDNPTRVVSIEPLPTEEVTGACHIKSQNLDELRHNFDECLGFYIDGILVIK